MGVSRHGKTELVNRWFCCEETGRIGGDLGIDGRHPTEGGIYLH